MENEEHVKLQEIEDAFASFKTCPKCHSKPGFWLGLKDDRAYVQCKGCGAKFELYEVYMMSGGDKVSKRLRLLRK